MLGLLTLMGSRCLFTERTVPEWVVAGAGESPQKRLAAWPLSSLRYICKLGHLICFSQ